MALTLIAQRTEHFVNSTSTVRLFSTFFLSFVCLFFLTRTLSLLSYVTGVCATFSVSLGLSFFPVFVSFFFSGCFHSLLSVAFSFL